MFERIAEYLRRRPPARTFHAIQIEVTTRCVLRCVMCPRVALADEWQEVDLPWETFQRIARAFGLVEHVHLQGWGEPLLHPLLFDMIALAKTAGCRVGLTTNGMRLDQEAARRLLDLKLDLIAISIAGATRGTHEGIRVGSDFPLIVENVRRLLGLRRDQGRDRPRVELSYLMTSTNMEELPQAVDLAASLGADELYAINLDYVVTPEHDALKAFGCPPPLCEAFAQSVGEARRRAKQADLPFRPYPLRLEETAVCELDPTRILFISADGWVSPCTYLTLPGLATVPRWFEGRRVSVPAVRFGNVLEQGLMSIWESAAARRFRRRFLARRAGLAALAFTAPSRDDRTASQLPPPPEPCRTCSKLCGV